MVVAKKVVKVWDAPLRVFHWALVTAIAFAFLTSEADNALNQWHILAGWIAGLLIVFRLVWGLVGGEHSRFSDFIRPSGIVEHVSGLLNGEAKPTLGHNPLGAISVVVLLALVAGTVWSGAFGGKGREELHALIAWVLLAMVGLHIVAVIVVSLLERENLARAMITGKKSLSLHHGAADAVRPGAVALMFAIAVIVLTILAVLRYDPQAFSPRNTEAIKNHSGSAGNGMESERGD